MVLQFSFGDPKVVHDVPVEKPWSTGRSSCNDITLNICDIKLGYKSAKTCGKRGGGQNSQYYVTSFMEDPTNQ